MFYVYLLRSIANSHLTYVGFTTDLEARLRTHNMGGSAHTSSFRPWKLVASIAFDEETKARSFEKYIKSGSGYAFAKKRFW